jgi:hypothetical protein
MITFSYLTGRMISEDASGRPEQKFKPRADANKKMAEMEFVLLMVSGFYCFILLVHKVPCLSCVQTAVA